MNILVRLGCVALLALLASGVQADERILGYHADIQVRADGGMDVTETIQVRAEGQRIRRGIYRDFPTTYKDPLGHGYKVAFEPLAAQRDGRTEPWHTETLANGVRVYFGSEHVFLAPGEYTYTFRYRTTRQLGFFDAHDELYWNVTGNGWDFAIDEASATVRLPQDVPAEQLEAFGYTGFQGSRDAHLTAATFDGGARYRTTRPLMPSQGLSLVLEFPKGVIAEPTRRQRLSWLLADNSQLVAAAAGLLLLWLYYGIAWVRYGRDPARGVQVPLYEPPRGYSPASLRFIRRMGYDKDTFAAAILGLAAKGGLEIEEDDKKVITLRPTGKQVALAPGERAIVLSLFRDGQPLTLKQSIHAKMQAAIKAHKAALAADYEKKYFNTHGRKLVPGLLISLATLLLAIVSIPGDMKFAALFLLFWLTGWSFGAYAFSMMALAALRSARSALQRIGAVFTSAVALPFLLFELAGLVALAFIGGAGLAVAFLLLIGTNIAFYHWMKAPTQDGAKLLDQIEGFRWYLGVAEKQELDARYHLDARPELFAAYLPYAFALDVEQAWAQRFAEALPTAAQQKAATPNWYHGSHDFGSGRGLAGFTSSLGSSLGSAISSSSTAPGSSSGGSSGSSGGGSGGGGGGGGGGGW